MILFIPSTTVKAFNRSDAKKVQTGLVVIKSNGRAVPIKERKKIRIWTADKEKPVTGRFQIVNDSTISIDQVSIPIHTIKKISTIWPMVFVETGATVVGAFALFVGGVILVWGWEGASFLPYLTVFAPPAVFLYFTNKGKFPLISKEIGEDASLAIQD